MNERTEDPPRSRDLPPGFDEDDPYEGVDIETLPDWWIRNIETFREHDMRPYRPPRFADGETMPDFIEALERELGATIRLFVLDPSEHDAWELRVDGDSIGVIDKYRSGEGYSIFEIESTTFEERVREHVSSTGDGPSPS